MLVNTSTINSSQRHITTFFSCLICCLSLTFTRRNTNIFIKSGANFSKASNCNHHSKTGNTQSTNFYTYFHMSTFINFTARCMSVCDVDVPWAYRLDQLESNCKISLGSSLLGATTSAIQSKRNTPKIRVEWGWVGLLGKPSISLKRGKIGPWLLLMTYRKSHTCFRLV